MAKKGLLQCATSHVLACDFSYVLFVQTVFNAYW